MAEPRHGAKNLKEDSFSLFSDSGHPWKVGPGRDLVSGTKRRDPTERFEDLRGRNDGKYTDFYLWIWNAFLGSQADFGLISRMPRGDAPFKVLDKRIRLPLSIFESVSIDLDSVSPEETRQVLGENEQAYLLIQRVEDESEVGSWLRFTLSFVFPRKVVYSLLWVPTYGR